MEPHWEKDSLPAQMGYDEALLITARETPVRRPPVEPIKYRTAFLLAALALTLLIPENLRAEVAGGTLIQLADGQSVPVQAAPVSGMVRGVGADFKVVSASQGDESEPMVSLTDERGADLLLSGDTPVITPTGSRLAKALFPGDRVLTDKGVSRLKRVRRIAHYGPTWLLRLADPAGYGETVYFANGFLVGDLTMRETNKARDAEELTPALERLSPEWLKSYEAARAR